MEQTKLLPFFVRRFTAKLEWFPKGITLGKEAGDLSSMQEIIPLKEERRTPRFMEIALKKLARKNIAKMPLRPNIQHETHTVEELNGFDYFKIEHTDKKQVPFEECFPAFNRAYAYNNIS